jgi:hypothetical protein
VALATGQQVSPQYFEKLKQLPSETYIPGTVDMGTTVTTPGVQPQMQNITMPLKTFERLNVPMDVRGVMMNNT